VTVLIVCIGVAHTCIRVNCIQIRAVFFVIYCGSTKEHLLYVLCWLAWKILS